MNVKDLKSFEAVYEERGINQAAQKLFITPQGLSRNIKMLESELDTVPVSYTHLTLPTILRV